MAFATVEGTVSRIHGTGSGFSIVEEWESKGKPGKRYWAVFPKESGSVMEGEHVKVTGSLGTKVSTSERGTFVDHTIGSAKVERTGGGTTPAPAPEAAPAPDATWPEPVAYDEAVPF